jgi:ribosomal protein S18 acetylase RimI-like enzyme
VSFDPVIRSELRPGDLGAIVAHHGRVYGAEYGVDASFEGHVAATVAEAGKRGFPSPREAIRLVELDAEHAGSIALTDEGNEAAAIRWFVLSPELRGQGLGRRLLEEILESAAELGYSQVWLETFSELEAAAHLYRDHGFEVVSADTRPRWGRERISYQRYELELSAAPAGLSA